MKTQIKRSMWAMLTTFMMLGVIVSSSAYAIGGGNGSNDDDHGSDGQKYTICHRSTSVTNPYIVENVNISAIDGTDVNPSSDHSHHTGPIASSQAVAQSLKDSKTKWGDIIPSVPGLVAGQNWNDIGKAMLANDCNYAKVATASVSMITATCESGEQLVYGPIVKAVYSGTPNGTYGPTNYSVTATAFSGYLFNNQTSTLTFTGVLAGPLTDEGCSPKPEVKTATASVGKLPATCTTGEKLIFSNVQYATASGTAEGTTGPADFDVIFTANSGAQFDNKGTTTLEFKGSLDGPKPSTDASCVGGKGSTEVPTTPSTPATPTTVQPIKALPYTAGDTGTTVIAGGTLLTTLLGFAGVRRLFGHAL